MFLLSVVVGALLKIYGLLMKRTLLVRFFQVEFQLSVQLDMKQIQQLQIMLQIEEHQHQQQQRK